MSVCYEEEDGSSVYYLKGALETILPKCKSFYDPSHNVLEIEEYSRKMSNQGLRVVALARGLDSNNLTFVGLGKLEFSTNFHTNVSWNIGSTSSWSERSVEKDKGERNTRRDVDR
jgi:magnesium-transporting ATPase (P-type)